ncbi:MAG: hypothetical protein M0R74_16170 [Dehalococcoidia bacterium]|nr:hypothetical protein [Dehalococcoidia bacterium]
MTSREEVAQAMAYFESSDDIGLLHQLVEEVAPRAKRMVGQFLRRGNEDSIPPPADLRAAREPAERDAAVRTLRATNEFPLLQVLARSIGQRIETLELTASVEFPEGARVSVPESNTYPPNGTRNEGTVESTGTSLRVRLDNGETWQGPPSLARRAGGES